MKTIVLHGSPRKNKNSDTLAKYFIQGLSESVSSETKHFYTNEMNIRPCQGCLSCANADDKSCIIKDDMEELYPLIREAEGIIIASPVYNGGISAQTKAVMDRTRALLASDPNSLRGKVGIAIAIGGDRAGGQELAIQQIMTFYTLNGVLTLSGGFFGANIGATFWSRDTMEGIISDEEGFKSLRKTIMRFSEFLRESESSKF